MLRARLGTRLHDVAAATEECWRVSSGSAAVLGLQQVAMDAAPTTAYLMLGDRCSRNCAFCTQARESHARQSALSRVTWPLIQASVAADAVARAYLEGTIERACFQVTVSPGSLARTERAVADLARRCPMPISVSIVPRSAKDVERLLGAGAERVTMALDAACERVHRSVKGRSWSGTMSLLESCARSHPGSIGTHLIVGLGETEREMAECMQMLADLSVSIGLFAFTPVRGTALQDWAPPSLAQYRRMQVARWLMVNGLARTEQFEYEQRDGRLCHLGLDAERLRSLLAGGDAFRTSGCAGCNRPYYNERPGGVMYNYPGPLAPVKVREEVEALVEGLIWS